MFEAGELTSTLFMVLGFVDLLEVGVEIFTLFMMGLLGWLDLGTGEGSVDEG